MSPRTEDDARPDDAPWDLLVVGGGTAGIVAARTAGTVGARVLLVERDRTGGDCLWTGCVPSKALLAAASAAVAGRRAQRLGVRLGPAEVDFAAVRAHVQRSIATIEPEDSPDALRRRGAQVVHGTVRFTGPDTADVDGSTVRFRQALVCTGSAPVLPAVDGLADVDPLTSESIWDVEGLPGRLAVLGGGTIGCELGQAFARLGSQVTLVESADRLLGREDADAAEILRTALTADGVDVRLGAEVVRVAGTPAGGRLVLASGDEIPFDRLLVCVGRAPRTDGLGLDQAGVELEDDGHIRVDDRMRTTSATIWAAGDVTPRPKFTHVGGVDAGVATLNALLGLRRSVDLDVLPRVTFTEPEVAACGVAPADALPQDLTVLEVPHSDADRAITEADTDGFTKLVVDSRGRIRGATVVGPRAGETLGELGLAVSHGLTVGDLTQTLHSYPTFNDGAWNAAIEHYQASLGSAVAGTAVRLASGARRRWLDSRLHGRRARAQRA